MHKEVKIGIALGAVLLIVAVSYFGTNQPKDDITLSSPQNPPARDPSESQLIEELFAQTTSPIPSPRSEHPSRDGSMESRPAAPDHSSSSRDSKPETAHTDNHPDPVAQRPIMSDADHPADSPDRIGSAVLSSRPTEVDAHRSPRLPNSHVESDRASALSETAVHPEQEAQNDATTNETQWHTVLRGDTFSDLARRYYGHPRYVDELIAANPQVDPRALKIGTQLKIPPPHPTQKGKGDTRLYEVKEGDTLYDIARTHLGDGSRWKEIHERNREVIGSDPSDLKVGQKLILPEA